MRLDRNLLIVGIAFLIAAGIGLYKLHIPELWGGIGNIREALALSAVVLVGLTLIVVLMSVLVLIYSVIGVSDSTQALALPEGSVRALIAFSLVLIFVCLGAFLYNTVNHNQLAPAGKSVGITEAQLSDLKTQFVVAYEPARTASGAAETDTDGKSPIYNATYFFKPGNGEDFAKQIFTTLATVFVSVISFYFGSSTTSSAVDRGAKAASRGTQSPSTTTVGGSGDAKTVLTDDKGGAGQPTDEVVKAEPPSDAMPVDPSEKRTTATIDDSTA